MRPPLSRSSRRRRRLAPPELPFPFSDVSNGEWCPRPPSRRQRAAAALFREEAERRARRLGLSRREFLRSAAGTATAFMVLNSVYGLPSSGSAAPLPVSPEQCDDPDAARELFARHFFVMDVQLHHVDLEAFSGLPPEVLCGLRFLEGELPCEERLERLSQANLVKEVFADSETDVGVISGVPNGIPLPVETMRETRDLVNELAGSERALIQAMIDPANDSGSTALETLDHQVRDNGARAIKCYTASGNWWLDDEQIAYPMYEEALRLGLRIVNVHKGFPSLLGDMAETYVRSRDLPKATADWPGLEFVVYHAGYFPRPDPIGEFLEVVRGMGRRRNLYAEIGSAFAVAFTSGPEAAAHLVGSLLKELGSWRILWGTDSIWWGSPQWQIDAFKALTIPPSMQEEFGYPPLTHAAKRRILGLNAARLYGVDIHAKRCEIEADRIAGLRRELRAAGSPRVQLAYGPRTRRQFEALLAHAGGSDGGSIPA